MGRSRDWWGGFFPSFQKFFQCSVSVTKLSIFSPFLKFVSHSLFVLTGQPNQYCCQATSVLRESECIISSLAVISSRPQFFSVSQRGLFFLDCTHRVRWNGVPNHSVLRGIPISFSANLLTRLQLFCGRKTISVFRRWACFLYPWPWGLQAMVLGVSLSAAVLQDSLPSAPRFPRFPQSKPPVASPPTVVWLWMPEAELILVDVWPRLTRLIYCLAIHTQAVQPS